MATDMLVKLYDLPSHYELIEKLEIEGIHIKRALPIDKKRIVDYVRNSFNEAWANECDVALSKSPSNCYVAVYNKEIIGFATYNSTCLGFFGPTGVNESFRGKQIGKALLLKSLNSMWEEGYAYAIIGWVGPIEFYKKAVNAIIIEDSHPGIYKRMIDG